MLAVSAAFRVRRRRRTHPRRAGCGSPASSARILAEWAHLPLRAFLGFTFYFARLQKLANPAFLDAANPASIQTQMTGAARRSPIHALISPLAHHAALLGAVIALGEVAVGVGALRGLLTRIAAIGGLLLSLNLFLAVSFHTSPHYTGSDIVFVFAWIPLYRRRRWLAFPRCSRRQHRCRSTVVVRGSDRRRPASSTRRHHVRCRGGRRFGCGRGGWAREVVQQRVAYTVVGRCRAGRARRPQVPPLRLRRQGLVRSRPPRLRRRRRRPRHCRARQRQRQRRHPPRSQPHRSRPAARSGPPAPSRWLVLRPFRIRRPAARRLSCNPRPAPFSVSTPPARMPAAPSRMTKAASSSPVRATVCSSTGPLARSRLVRQAMACGASRSRRGRTDSSTPGSEGVDIVTITWFWLAAILAFDS